MQLCQCRVPDSQDWEPDGVTEKFQTLAQFASTVNSGQPLALVPTVSVIFFAAAHVVDEKRNRIRCEKVETLV